VRQEKLHIVYRQFTKFSSTTL